MIHLRCPGCKQVLKVPPERAGARVACPSCKKVLVVPAPAAAPVTAAAPAPPPAASPPAPAPAKSASRNVNRLGSDFPDAPPLNKLPCERLPPATPPEAETLGKPLASLRWGYSYGYWPLILAAGPLLLGLATSLLSVLLLTFGKHPQENDSFGFVCGALLFVLAGAMAAYALLSLKYNPPIVAWVCPRGLIWARKNLVRWCRWDEVEELRAKTAIVTVVNTGQIKYYYTCDLVLPGGEKLALRGTRIRLAAKSFGDHIQQETTRALLPISRRRMSRGEALEFPPFELSAEGIARAGKSLPWRDFSRVAVSNGWMTIHGPGDQPWAKDQLGDVSHALVLLALLEEKAPVRGQ